MNLEDKIREAIERAAKAHGFNPDKATPKMRQATDAAVEAVRGIVEAEPVDFANWIVKNGYQKEPDGSWTSTLGRVGMINTQELYDLYTATSKPQQGE